jgi:hypothetical protein
MNTESLISAIKAVLVAYMKIAVSNRENLGMLITGVIMVPISFAALGNTMVFMLLFGIGVGCLIKAGFRNQEVKP